MQVCANARLSRFKKCSKLSAIYALMLLFGVGLVHAQDSSKQVAASYLKRMPEKHGVVVVITEQLNGELGIELAKQSSLTVFVQTDSQAAAEATMRAARIDGLLGTRVTVSQSSAGHIGLADNLADAVIVHDTKFNEAEILRALRPQGVGLVDDRTIRKPVPAGSGDWTHPYHGSDNNPQSKDSVAKAPYLTHFLATPWYGPMPQVTVSAGGRLFKVFGHLAFKKREWPLLGKLVAMNAYNGTRLWERDLAPGFMVHRSTIIATPDTLYLADNESLKLINTSDGKIREQVIVPDGISDGPAWKWMTIKNGKLIAMVGEAEKLHTVQRGNRTVTGWPWTTVRATYGPFQGTWGFGRTLFSMDLKSRKVDWVYRTKEPLDSRTTCMHSGRIFVYSHRRYVAAVDEKTGQQLWKSAEPDVLDAIGEHDRAQTARLGYSTSAYAKCNADVLLFAGPQRHMLVAVSAESGSLLWTHDDGNVQLVLRDDGLYAMGRMNHSKKFDYLTGKVLAELQCFRGNCTRATGSADSIFARGYRHSGTLRLNVDDSRPTRLPAMRPACQDGVIVANGRLYWGPWMCDCNHSLVGVVSLGSAGPNHDFNPLPDAARLEISQPSKPKAARFETTVLDWPTYRANNQRNAVSSAVVAGRAKLLWSVGHKSTFPDVREKTLDRFRHTMPTAPVAAGGLVFVSGRTGTVRAMRASSGDVLWTADTGGSVIYPPTVANDRVYVGSGDGHVYCLDAMTGTRIWRYRGAPHERRIPAHGKLTSTWPVASGVMVEDGVAYFGAGLISHDGTHLYAVDAATGRLIWHNGTSGNLATDNDVVGVSVQGHMLFHDKQVFMAGGNVVSPAKYDAKSGKCWNTLDQKPTASLDDHWKMQRSPRGSELFVIENQVVVGGRMLYSPIEEGPPSRYYAQYGLQVQAGEVIIQGDQKSIYRVNPKPGPDGKPQLIWKATDFDAIRSVALSPNAVVVAGRLAESQKQAIAAIDAESGKRLWSHPLPAQPVNWGVAIDRHGRVLVSLLNGGLLCYGER